MSQVPIFPRLRRARRRAVSPPTVPAAAPPDPAPEGVTHTEETASAMTLFLTRALEERKQALARRARGEATDSSGPRS